MEKICVQQGDCILVSVNEVPKTAKKVNVISNSFIVLRGEGVNTHELQSISLISDVEIFQEGNTLYIKALKDMPLVHQEHGTTIIHEGDILKRRIEREFDYESMEARNTQD